MIYKMILNKIYHMGECTVLVYIQRMKNNLHIETFIFIGHKQCRAVAEVNGTSGSRKHRTNS